MKLFNFVFVSILVFVFSLTFFVKLSDAAVTVNFEELIENSPWPGYDQAEYDQQCPYGDVVVIQKGDENLPEKYGMVYDCIFHRPGDLTWTIKDYDHYTNTFVIRHIDPNKYNVYVMEGKLILNKDKVTIQPQ